jgi:branched-chain amino acid transport system ATP-binding protein
VKALQGLGLTKHYRGVKAVQAVDFEVEEGQCRVILGPNGAGKTTLFHLLSGLVPPTSGRIFLFGEEITHLPPHARAQRGLARTFQVTSLFPRLTVRQNVLLGAQARGAKYAVHRPATSYSSVVGLVDKMLEDGGLAGRRDAPVKSLSYGEQRQLEVIVALASQPRVLLLDESTAGLSEVERTSMTRLLQRLRATAKVSIVLVSHDIDVAFALADAITVMHLGEVLVEGAPEVVRQDPRVTRIYLGEEMERQRA